MTYCILDIETSTFKSGNPFSIQNEAILIGIRKDGENHFFWTNPISKTTCLKIQELIENSSFIVGFNLKFDLNWLSRLGFFDLVQSRLVWDCQLAEFILSGQSNRMPSLDNTAEKFGLPVKPSVVREYWEAGVDTKDIPKDILTEYLKHDLETTEALFLKQKELLAQKPIQQKLVSLHNKDLLCLQEMEFFGLRFNEHRAKEEATKVSERLRELDSWLLSYFGEPRLNLSSNDHLSAALFGGTITIKTVEQYQHTYKTGPKKGLTAPRNKHHAEKVTFNRRIDPLEGSELAKEGFWSTDQTNLRLLKAKGDLKICIQGLLERAELQKLLGTYLNGLCELRESHDWPENRLHGQFHQTVARTGRLSSSNPNFQNLPINVAAYMETEYAD